MNRLPTTRFTSFAFLACIVSLTSVASLTAKDDPDPASLEQFRKPQARANLHVPDLPGFLTLKCDFHIHTVFSDGQVWPSVRVQEAWEEGLDAICITDHIEYQPHAEDLPPKRNRPFEIAKPAALESNILLIKGSEITRNTPPGHFNALFLTDSDKLPTDANQSFDQMALDEAAAQKAFVFWNHPGWKSGSVKGSYDWIPFVDKLHQEGKLHGIEVINGFGFYRKALDWCLDQKVAVMGSSDIHNLIAHDYDVGHGRTRTMTLVLAKERTIPGVREALEAARTVAWSNDLLAGPEPLVQELVKASLSVSPVHHTDAKGVEFLELRNRSGFRFTLECAKPAGGLPKTIQVEPDSSVVIKGKEILKSLGQSPYEATNLYIRSDQHPSVRLGQTP